MGKFFNLDSPLMRFMTKLADLMILNLLFLITCIPVITIGAAWTSLYYVTLKMVKDEESGIIRSYFRSFKQNFRQATILWLGILVIAAVLVLDLVILARIDSPVAAAMNMGIGILAILGFLVLQYLFPLLAKFDAGTVQTLKNACILAVAHLPRTLLMAFCSVGAVIITLYNAYTLSLGILIWLLIGFGIMAFSNSSILAKIFDTLAAPASAQSVGNNSQ